MDVKETLKNIGKEAASAAKEALASVQDSNEPVGQKPAGVSRKVMVIIFNPKIKSENGKKLSEVMNWSNPDELTTKYIADLRDISHGYANFNVLERVEVDRFPVKEDGFVYDGDEFVKSRRANAREMHKPDAVDYSRILKDFDILNKIKSGTVDEIWMYGGPYMGFYESIMGGPGAFWCNAPELKNTEASQRRFVIMGFNYERAVGQMLENMGHRAESIMKYAFRNKHGDDNLYERFIRYDQKNPGQAEVGWMHYAPNSVKDYDWGNKTVVKSRYHTWENFPNLEGQPQDVECSHWGNGEIRAHHMWWFRLLPHITGSSGGISYNWWKYIIQPDYVI